MIPLEVEVLPLLEGLLSSLLLVAGGADSGFYLLPIQIEGSGFDSSQTRYFRFQLCDALRMVRMGADPIEES